MAEYVTIVGKIENKRNHFIIEKLLCKKLKIKEIIQNGVTLPSRLIGSKSQVSRLCKTKKERKKNRIQFKGHTNSVKE